MRVESALANAIPRTTSKKRKRNPNGNTDRKIIPNVFLSSRYEAPCESSVGTNAGESLDDLHGQDGEEIAPDLVVPGDYIPVDPDALCGHGTSMISHNENSDYSMDDANRTFVSNLGGRIKRVHKLVQVECPQQRYVGSVGDVIVGRIVSVGAKTWSVDVGGRQHAGLPLSSVILPGKVQRRKTKDDQLQMRSFFAEGDLISCEVQMIYRSGNLGIHTRSKKYGKLKHGQLIIVSHELIPKQRSHFITLQSRGNNGYGLRIIMGRNGWIWVGSTQLVDGESNTSRGLSSMEGVKQQQQSLNPPTKINSLSLRREVGLTVNCISLLSRCQREITEETITLVRKRVEERGIALHRVWCTDSLLV
eukprot:g2707.t1